jgi:spore coat polysaccharide biosynthesis protein SpsF (cytidylyltransferase family)
MLANVGVIVASRMGSSRLPGKALKPLSGRPMILFLLERLASSRAAGSIVVATTTRTEDDVLRDTVADAGYAVHRGSEDDVVQRFVGAAETYGFDWVVRVTADCPLVDGETLDYVLDACSDGDFDLASTKGCFPVGIDFEIYRAAKMKELDRTAALTTEDREHLTWHMVRQPDAFRIRRVEPRAAWRWDKRALTVDTPEDYAWVSALVAHAGSVCAPVSDLLAAAEVLVDRGGAKQ